MKSIRIDGKEDVKVITSELKQELRSDECLMKCHKSLISPGTELSRVYALKKGATYPVSPGYCSVGTVLELGKDVKDVELQARYLYSAPHASMHHFNQLRSDGGVLYKLNEKTTDEEGCFLMMIWIAMNGILPIDVKITDKVGIFGLGNLGLILTLLYKQMGCEVYAIDVAKNRGQKAEKLGIENIIDVAPEQQMEMILDKTEGHGFDVVVDASGMSRCIEVCFQAAARYGNVVLLGSPREDYHCNVTPMLNAIHMKMLNVVGGFNRRYPFSEEVGSKHSMQSTFKYLEKLLNKKIIDVNQFVTHTIKPEEAMDAYRGLMYDKDNYLGVIIDWEE